MKALFKPVRLGRIELKNRMIRSATWESMADEDGHMNGAVLDHYEALAKGGASALITGYAFVLADEQPNPRMFGAYDDTFIEDYKPLVEKVHAQDCRLFLQLVYGGSFTWHETDNREIWGPSAVTNKISGITPKEMTPLDMQTLIKAFGDAARRAEAAGFDGVQLHAGREEETAAVQRVLL